ncbi:MAG: hypothetical protein D8M59_00480 [Planctomycetes bacterium]|nr:hypothetical protein [Planctomycetota bacterium]NOG54806.1 hypothetical protein [Planctomycetota bacterium]
MHTSQMTESTVNLELVEALKKHGPNVLVVLALLLLGVRGWIWWQETRTERIGQAWVEWGQTDSYGSMAGFVNQYEEVGSVSDMASLSAASLRLYEVYLDVSPTWVPPVPDPDDPLPPEDEVAPPMTPEERSEALDDIEVQYRMVLDRTQDDPGKELLTAKAMFGLATVAEMRQDNDGATAIYNQIQETLSDNYPDLKTLCQTRIDSLERGGQWTPLPTAAELAAATAPPVPEPADDPAEDPEEVTEPVETGQDAEAGTQDPETPEGTGDETGADDPGDGGNDDGTGGGG